MIVELDSLVRFTKCFILPNHQISLESSNFWRCLYNLSHFLQILKTVSSWTSFVVDMQYAVSLYLRINGDVTVEFKLESHYYIGFNSFDCFTTSSPPVFSEDLFCLRQLGLFSVFVACQEGSCLRSALLAVAVVPMRSLLLK